MKKNALILRVVWLLAGVMMLPSPILAKAEYTYIKASIGYPWFMFFVFMALIMIPFVLIVVLSWRKQNDKEEHERSDWV